MQIISNEDIDKNSWYELLKRISFSSPFQTPEFYQFFNSVKNSTAEVIGIIENNKLIALVIVTLHKEKGVKGYFSHRGIIYGGPLIEESEHGKTALKILLKHLNIFYKKRLIYLEIRNLFDYNVFCDEFINENWDYIPYNNVQLKLKGLNFENIFMKMKYNRRREINLSINAGASVCEASNLLEVRQLYSILKALYESKVKLSLPSIDYFEKLYSSPIGKVFIVLHNNQIIGGSFCIQYPELSINTLYYAGMRDYNKKIFPTHIAIKGVIEYALNHKIPKVDFMGAGKPGIEYGVRDYKLQFGGDLVEHGRYLKVLNPIMYNLGKLGLKIMSKI